MCKYAFVDQAVVHDDIGRLQRRDCFQRQQFRIAGPGAHQNNAPARLGIEKTSHDFPLRRGV
jgi:hypothetical protein